MDDTAACPHCGHVGPPATHAPGHFGVEVVLWLLLIAPGVIYSVWRINSRREVCAKCGHAGLVPVDSPVGAQLAQRAPPAASAIPKPKPGAVSFGRDLGRLVRKLRGR